MFCDIDFLKEVNDQYGHQTADIVLKEIGSIIKTTIDNKGKAFRYGGEEFAVILEYNENSYEIADDIRISVSSSQTLKEVCPTLRITISIGIASYPKDADGVDNLIRKADLAMYYAKKNGRNQCQIFSRDMEKGSESRFI